MKFHPRKFPCHVPFRCPESLDIAKSLAGKISSETQDLIKIDAVPTCATLEQQSIDLRTGEIQMAMIASRGKIAGKLLDLAFLYNIYDINNIDTKHRLIYRSLQEKIYHGTGGEFRHHDQGAIANIGHQRCLNIKTYRNLLPKENLGSKKKVETPSSDLLLIGHQSLLILPTNLVLSVLDDYYLISLVTGYQTWNNIRKPIQTKISDLLLTLDTASKINIDDQWR